MRVLIAEDHAISRKILEAFLKPHGEATLAADGNEALTLFKAAKENNAPFDLVLLDMVMPHLSGLEVLEAIRKIEREVPVPTHVPIIMLTGNGDMLEINQAKTLGISDYMMKPIEEVKLIRELQRLGLVKDPEDQWG